MNKQVFLVLILSIISLSCNVYGQQCRTQIDSYNVYPIQGKSTNEILTLQLLKQFSGQNLTFSIDQGTPFPYAQIFNPLFQNFTNQQYTNPILSVDIQYNEAVDDNIALLQLDNTNNYYLGYQIVNTTNIQNVVKSNPFTQNTVNTCFSSVYIYNNILVADCQNLAGTETQLFVANSSNETTPYNNPGTLINNPIKSRKSLSYTNGQQIYYVQYVPDNQFTNPSTNYIDIYSYDSTPNPDNLQYFGNLTFVQNITYTDLKLTADTLHIVSVQASGNYLFIQDIAQGVYVVQFDATNKVTFIGNYLSKQNEKPLGQPLGMAVSSVGSQNVMAFVTDQGVYEFYWPSYDQGPKLINTYSDFTAAIPNGFAFTGLTMGFITVQYNGGITIFKRGQKDIYGYAVTDFYAILGADSIVNYYNGYVKITEIVYPTLAILYNKPDTTIYTFNVVATSTYNGQTETCKMQITSQQINENPQKLYPSGINQNPTLNNVSTTYNIMVPLGVKYIGTNLSYSLNVTQQQQQQQNSIQNEQEQQNMFQNKYFLKNQENIIEKPKTLQEQFPNLNMNITTNIPNFTVLSFNTILPETVTYISLFAISETSYQALVQQNTLRVSVFDCTGNYANDTNVYDKLTCLNPNNVHIDLDGLIVVYSQGFSEILQKNVFAVSTNETRNTIQGFYFDCTSIKSFPFASTDIVQNIMILDNFLYTIIAQADSQKIIYINYLGLDFKQYLIINSQLVSSYLPNGQTFNPINILGTRTLPGILFIQQTSFIMVLSVAKNIPLFMSNVMLNFPPQQTCNIWLAQENMITACDGPSGFIQEYTLLDLTQIVPTKQYSLYGWQVFTPLTAAFSWGTQMFYVLMQQGLDQFQIFVFKPNLPLVKTLYKSLYFNSTTVVTPQMIVNGINVDALYVAYNSSEYLFYRVPQQSSYIVSINMTNSIQYIQQVTINANITSLDKGIQTVSTDLQMVNINQQVTVNTQVQNNVINTLTEQFKIDKTLQTPVNIYFQDNNWYSGQVYSQQLTYENQNKNQYFTLINHLNISNDDFNANIQGSSPNDIYSDSNQNIYFLTSNYISVLNSQLTNISNLTLTGADNCMKLIPYNDNNGNLANLTAFCTVNTITTAFIINAIDPLNITLIETVTLLDINKVGDAQWMNNNLFILDLIIGQVYVYTVDNQGKATEVVIYNKQSFLMQQQPFNVFLTSFAMFNINETYTTIIFTNNVQRLFILHAKSNNYAQFDPPEVADAQIIMQLFHLALPSQEQIINIEIINTMKADNNQVIEFLGFTQRMGIFQAQISVDLTTLQVIPEKTKIVKVYAAYGQNSQTAKISILPNNPVKLSEITLSPMTFSVAYIDSTSKILTIAVYNTAKDPQPQPAATNPTVDLITMVGGTVVNLLDSSSFAFALVRNSNDKTGYQPFLFCSDQVNKKTQQYKYNPNMTLVVNNFEWPTSEKLTFTPLSLIQQDINYTINATIIVPIIPSPSSSPSEWEWYYTLIIVIGSVLLIGLVVGIVLYLKKRKTTTDVEEDSQLIDEQKDTAKEDDTLKEPTKDKKEKTSEQIEPSKA